MDKPQFEQHISHRFDADLEAIKSHVLAMGGLVERQIEDALDVIRSGKGDLAAAVTILEQARIAHAQNASHSHRCMLVVMNAAGMVNQARRAACPAAMREPIAAAAAILSPIQVIHDNLDARMTHVAGYSGQGRQLNQTAGSKGRFMHKRIVVRRRVTRRPPDGHDDRREGGGAVSPSSSLFPWPLPCGASRRFPAADRREPERWNASGPGRFRCPATTR